MTCTTEGCDTETEMYLCAQCVQDLDAWITKGRQLLPDLDVTIARLDVVRPTSNEGNNGTKSAGSTPPANLEAIRVKAALASYVMVDAKHLAHDEHAAGITTLIIELYNKAELLVSGPKDDTPTKERLRQAALDIRETIPEHMNGPDLSLWLKNVHQMTVYPFLIRKWAQRGNITRTNSEGRPTYSPAAVLVYARQDMLRKQKKTRRL